MWKSFAWGVGLVVATIFTGCAAAPQPKDKHAATAGGMIAARAVRAAAEKPPFLYEPLNVRNSCFVESVHFYDEYLRRERGGEESWARVLQWGNSDGDIKIDSGHAVAVFVVRGRLWFYDVNFGMLPIALGIDRRGDITDVAPQVFQYYPKFKPLFARYRDDYPQSAPPKRVEHLFYHANQDVRDATRVAHVFGKTRPAAVFEFELKQKGKKVKAAGVSFVFGRRVCLYFPRAGTHISPAWRGGFDDLRYIEHVIKRLYPDSDNVRWQAGGYLFFPPKEN